MKVLTNQVPDTMTIQKYDIRKPDDEGGGFEVRYWSPCNYPVFDTEGNITHIIYRVEDVTALMQLKK